MRMIAGVLALACVCAVTAAAAGLGVFEQHTDIGDTPKKGDAQFDAATSEYRITGGGANMWGNVDAFHYVWKRVSGDVTITADVRFLGAGTVAHRKAALVVRQSLEPGSAYADVAVHGDGLTSLQYRPTADAATLELRSTVTAPVRIRLERRGDQFTMYAGTPGEELKSSGPVTVSLQNPVYVGLGVCSHDANIVETAVFTNVKID
jgi:hypothetical protein